MNKLVYTLLVAKVIAEDGYTCTDPGDGTWTEDEVTLADATTAEECKAATDDFVEVANDYCVVAYDQQEVAEDTDAGIEAVAADFYCVLYIATAAELNIKEATEEGTDSYTISAWAYQAGVVLDDVTPAEEEDDAADDEEDDEEDEEEASTALFASAFAAAAAAMYTI